MSALFEQVKTSRLSARKSKDVPVVSILTTLLGELETQAKKTGKDVSDDLVIATCKKFIANNTETAKVASVAVAEELHDENLVLTQFLPKQLSEDEIREVVIKLNPANVGEAMTFLKANYSGQYDGRLASQVVKGLV